MPEHRRRILIADDHTIFREGLRLLLEALGYDVVGEASNGQEASDFYRSLHPEVLIIDLEMPLYTGLFGVEKILVHDPQARIVLLTLHDGDEDIWRGLDAGAKAYLLKDCNKEDLVAAIEAVSAGKRFIPADVGAKLAERIHTTPLSERENQVLGLLSQGRTNLDIAKLLKIAEGTVKTHVNAIMTKLGAGSRTEAVLLAQRRGLLR